ncbi:Gx transporter family protein [Fusobacterium gonidiaformans]|uniref:Gx transporter family protein n=1 Tax=Fusobacterium gonidiaformans TaxID=849 RepID=UPI0001BC65A5|nr:Gx transporter family protein [Fusobacterium gonidiaformans]AVQ16135.1 hypothetical protein C4N16_00540 [Fusobacterium gonidiaformans ATCC 25563]EFS28641.1 hypothetical protein FGAG_00962 [Fusobacterium gonidiaformans ATCC 25563]
MEVKKKREVYIAAFVLLALYLSLLESLIPKPFPWMKFGFSNIIILVILEKWDKKMAFEVLLLRIFIQALMLGTMFSPGFLVSLCSGFLSLCLTTMLYRVRKYLSLLSISCLSAMFHNAIQLVVVYFLLFRNISLQSKSIMIFVFGFLLLGVISGLITGILVSKLALRIPRSKDKKETEVV